MIQHLRQILLAALIGLFSCSAAVAEIYDLDSLWRIGHDPAQPDTGRLGALVKYANQAYLKRLPDSAIYFADLVIQEAHGKGLVKQEAAAYSTKGTAAYNKGEFEKAVHFHRICLALDVQIAYRRGVASCYNNLGNCYMKLGDLAKARLLFEVALNHWISMGDKAGSSATFLNLATIYTNYGDFARSIELNTQSLLIREEMQDEVGMASTHNNIGNLYTRQGDLALAKPHFRMAMAIRRRLGDQKGEANVMIGLGAVFMTEHKMDSAMLYLQSALRINRAAGDLDNTALTQVTIAEAYEMQGRFREAAIYCDSALVTYRQTANLSGQSVALNRLGKVRMGQGQMANAISAMEQSLSLAQTLQAPQEIRDAAQNLYIAHKSMGQYQKALEMQELYIGMRDSIQSEENKRAVIRQELKYEFEKEKLMKAQEKQAADRLLLEATARRDRLQYSLISGIVIFLLIGMVILGFLRINQKFAIAIVFLAFLVLFEFILVLIDPYTEPLTLGQPALKLLINLGLALLLTPIHHVLERLVHRRLLRLPAHQGGH